MTNVSSANPFLFVVGAPRSGTTLLKRMIAAHPLVTMAPETWWIHRYYKRKTGLTPEGYVTPEIVDHLFADKRFPRMHLARGPVEELVGDGRSVRYADFVSGLFDLFGQSEGKRLVGDKTPGYVRNIPILHELWPQAKFVHIIRDGRDVCLSVRNWDKVDRTVSHYATWPEDQVGTIGLWWKWHVGLGREAGRTLPPELYYEVRYEHLVEDPEGECVKLCAFLGLSFDPAMLEYHVGKTQVKSNHPWFPITRGLRKWSTQMSGEDISRFEAVASDQLSELGYEPGAGKLSAPMVEHGRKMRAVFEARPLPSLW